MPGFRQERSCQKRERLPPERAGPPWGQPVGARAPGQHAGAAERLALTALRPPSDASGQVVRRIRFQRPLPGIKRPSMKTSSNLLTLRLRSRARMLASSRRQQDVNSPVKAPAPSAWRTQVQPTEVPERRPGEERRQDHRLLTSRAMSPGVPQEPVPTTAKVNVEGKVPRTATSSSSP